MNFAWVDEIRDGDLVFYNENITYWFFLNLLQSYTLRLKHEIL